ncbi:hypothetical protein ACVWYG_003572 [Pedobacter sp. UYEF25]
MYLVLIFQITFGTNKIGQLIRYVFYNSRYLKKIEHLGNVVPLLTEFYQKNGWALEIDFLNDETSAGIVALCNLLGFNTAKLNEWQNIKNVTDRI